MLSVFYKFKTISQNKVFQIYQAYLIGWLVHL